MSKSPWQDVVAASRSETGRVRESNQDAFGVFDHAGGSRLFVVADGMGGHRGGEVASAFAVVTLNEACAASAAAPAERLHEAIAEANRQVFERAKGKAELAGMGTTVVAVLLAGEGGAYAGHVGDSRLYRLHAGELTALTADHSLVADLERKGYLTADEAAVHPKRHQLLRSVGPQREVEAEVAQIPFEPGDRLLLCSDGLCGFVAASSIAQALAEATPELAARTLVDLADVAGGEDNVSVVVIERPS